MIPFAATGEAAKSGPWGLAIILIFCVACYFLFKSMSKHLRKVREEFPTDLPNDPLTPPAEPDPKSATPAAAAPADEAAAPKDVTAEDRPSSPS